MVVLFHPTSKNIFIHIKSKLIKTLKFSIIFLLIGICFSCSNDDGLAQENEAAVLNEMFSAIQDLASSKECTDSSQWAFTNYGEKACGGPVGYIAYSTEIDTVLFLEKIEEHRTAQQNFNARWGIISDCSLPMEPEGVRCEDGSPVSEY